MNCKLGAIIVMLLLLAILTGCGQNVQSTEPAPDIVTEPSDTEIDPTEKENQVPMEKEPTQATETEPAESRQPTEPTLPTPTEPIEPSAMTEPVPDEPEVHRHVYTDKIVKPSCTNGGYTVHTCKCGDSYVDGKTKPVGHAYVPTTVAPTLWMQGYTTYTCSECRDSYTDDYTTISDADRQAFVEEVRVATLKYLNRYRVEQGSTSIPALPKLTKVADYRAVQLQTNYAHSPSDLREAAAYFKYGEYIAPEGWDSSEYYYSIPGQEAIGRGNWVGDADKIGQKIAASFRNSSAHWSYVGSSEYSHIALGICYNPSATGNYYWTVCIFVATTAQYG